MTKYVAGLVAWVVVNGALIAWWSVDGRLSVDSAAMLVALNAAVAFIAGYETGQRPR